MNIITSGLFATAWVFVCGVTALLIAARGLGDK